MKEKDKTDIPNSEELSLAEKRAKLRAERMAQREKKISERNSVIDERSRQLAEKYGFTAYDSSKASKDNGKERQAEATPPAKEESTVIDSAPKAVEAAVAPAPKSKQSDSGISKLSLILSCLSVLLIAFMLLASAYDIFHPASQKGSEPVYIQVEKEPIKGDSYDNTSAMLEDVMSSVVIVRAQSPTGSSTGSGVIFTENGYILTNYHIIEGAESIQVKLKDADKYTAAQLIGYKSHDDIAVLKIEKTGLRPITFASSKDCRVGEKVFAIGCPLGAEYAWSTTQGIISATQRYLKIYNTTTYALEKKLLVIQTDVPVNPGNSGGPLIDASGNMVGVITRKFTVISQSTGALTKDDTICEGMGFALPSDEVLQMVTGIVQNGSGEGVKSTVAVGRPLIGITGVGVEKGNYYRTTLTGIEKVSAVYANNNPDTTFFAEIDGVRVTGINKGADSENKLKVGDTITHVSGAAVYTVTQITDIINDLSGGDSVELKIYRDGKTIDVTVILGTEELK